MLYHIVHVIIYAFMISYSMLMHIGSTEEITLLEFNEEEEEDQQETPQAAALGGEEPTLKDLPECLDHRPTSFLKGKPQSILCLPVFYKIRHESFMFVALGYKSWLETLDAWNYLVQIHIPLTLCRSRIEYMLSHA